MALDINTFAEINKKASEQFQNITNDTNSNIEEYKKMPSVIGIIPDELKDLTLENQKGDLNALSF